MSELLDEPNEKPPRALVKSGPITALDGTDAKRVVPGLRGVDERGDVLSPDRVQYDEIDVDPGEEIEVVVRDIATGVERCSFRAMAISPVVGQKCHFQLRLVSNIECPDMIPR